jgi:hypothetical protein
MGRIGPMTSAQGRPGRGAPVELFHATSGRFVGTTTLAVLAAIVVYVVVDVHSIDGLRLGTGAVFFGVLVWVTQLRPRAVAYRDVLLLRNSLRDVDVPLALIDDVHVGRMLTVWVGEQRYVCVGIGAPLRNLVSPKKAGSSSGLAWDRLEEDSKYATPPRPAESLLSYPEFVESRIASLSEDARRRRKRGADVEQRPHGEWAWSGVVALAVSGVAFVVSLLL